MAIPKGCKRELEIARQACLYGEGDGRPVMNIARLAELAGVHEQTIHKHLPAWQKEREEILAQSSPVALGISLSANEIKSHQADMTLLRKEINQVKWELDHYDDDLEKLEGIVQSIAEKCEDPSPALAMLDRYLRLSLNKQNLRKQFLALQKQWTGLSGIEGLMDVALVREREMEKGRVKIALKKEDGAAEPRNVGPTKSAVFVRRNAQEALPLESVREDEEDSGE